MLSIIVVNYKNPALLRLCLKSLARTLNKDFQREIIVVDVASEMNTQAVAEEEFNGIILLSFKENIGFTKGVNEGIKASKGDYFLILNSDVIPLKGAVEDMYSYISSHPNIGLIGPQLLNFDGTIQSSCFRFPSPWTTIYRRTFLGATPFAKRNLSQFLMEDINKNNITEVDWLMGSALMGCKKCIDKIGYMDEKLFLYMSDVDWPRRFWENGYTVVYYPLAQMYHYHRRESKGVFGMFDVLFKKQSRIHVMDALRYFIKYKFKTSPSLKKTVRKYALNKS